jgi:hypothetical protein
VEGASAEKFEISRSPVPEALLAVDKERTVIISPYKGAIVKPLADLSGPGCFHNGRDGFLQASRAPLPASFSYLDDSGDLHTDGSLQETID